MVDVEAGAVGRGGALPQGKSGGVTRRTLPGETARGHHPCPEEAHVTNEQWVPVRPLLSPQRGGAGRPRHGHRAVLGVLWVARTGSSWREMPEEPDKWEPAYRRYEMWVQHGLCPRLLRALGEEA
jgi:hypothetical protein